MSVGIDPGNEVLKHRHPDVRLNAGSYSAAISSYGSSLRELTYNDKPLVVGFAADEYPPMSSGNILCPWPNRIADGTFIHSGRLYRLDITEPERANAIHGFVRESRWDIVEQTDNSATLILRDGSHIGWPWFMNYTVRWRLDAECGLSCTLDVVNADADTAPLAIGFHPYITAHGHPLDDCVLYADVDSYLPLEPQRNLPAGPVTPIDALGLTQTLHDGLLMRNVFFDHCFGPLKKDNGTTAVRLEFPETGDTVVLRSTAPCRWLQIFTADPARRAGYPGVGRALAVEPMTAPPNAFRSGLDLINLRPQESITATYSIAAG